MKAVPVEMFPTFFKHLGDGKDRVPWIGISIGKRECVEKSLQCPVRFGDVDHRCPPRFIRILVHVLNLCNFYFRTPRW